MKKIVTTGCAVIAALCGTQVMAYEAGAVINGGKVTGKVSFKGTVPAPKKLPITKDNATCGTGERQIVEVSVKGGALAGAVVYIAKIEKGKAWSDPVDNPMLDQKGCTFTPDTMIIKRGADLTVRNSDPVLHNIHTYEIIGAVRRTMFNLGQPDKGDLKQPVKTKRSNFIKIECDAHDFMHSWAFAADNPYAVATKEDGSFALDNLPAGDYEIRAWHPILGEKSAKVSVPAGGAVTTAFEFTK